ncbi:L-rhamnose mutarotase [Cohnella thailandensis]|uniref:L-rhamnose mutarotase n=1 Tax=Cohnella thailandensis TaxID=557557 RepID=A0A841SWF5_9BACL|nr:L-rhamnose mutarotase [Cohnella thailandensis]MBB6634956.1 L-rhamnose mutarotase [Cohnella thailandensis]MBP1975822.1 L-rhamnose mutarotase [Cohnella thailandensis]
MAALKPDRAEEYERLHAEQPAEIAAQLRDKGFVHLDIYRSGLTLIMAWDVDPDREIEGRIVREEAEREWELRTGDCFAESWKEIPLIYKLDDHIHKAAELEVEEWGGVRED